ncbi:N-acetyltransferase [Spirochaetia bacterium]|nr:N-acetyltransferase [Spirochaetia bacterium]
MIRPIQIRDAPAIRDIYNYYIENTVATFEEAPVTVSVMEGRIRDTTAKYPWVVWEEGGEVTGYAYAHQWHERAAYRFSAEDSIYLKAGCEGRGTGGKLLAPVLEELKKMGIHVVMSVITLPNERSVALHERFGFKKSARFHEIGYKMNQWLDVGYWELLL